MTNMPVPVLRALVLLLSVAASLGGCGYHLRGSVQATTVAKDLYLDGPAWLADELQIILEAGGGRVLAGPDGADGIVRYRNAAFDRRVVSVDPRTGKEREIGLVYSLYFDLISGSGERVADNARIAISRDYTLDPDAVLGKGSEEEVLRNEMVREAAAQLLRRVEAALK